MRRNKIWLDPCLIQPQKLPYPVRAVILPVGDLRCAPTFFGYGFRNRLSLGENALFTVMVFRLFLRLSLRSPLMFFSSVFPCSCLLSALIKTGATLVQRPLTPFPPLKYHASFPLSNKTRYICFAAEIRLFPVFLFFGGSVVLGCVDGIRPGSFGL